MTPPPPLSGTHRQIAAVLATELAGRTGRVRLLDAGCGDGLLMGWLARALPALLPGVTIEAHGFDVGDHGLQAEGYFAATRARLSADDPACDWSARLALISERDAWPWPDGFFDAVVSNQVLEHVRDHDFFFAQMARTLAVGGVGVHVFPTRHTLIEPHLAIPLAHRFRSCAAIRATILLFSRAGLGLYRAHRRADPGLTPEIFADRHVDFYVRLTNFRTTGELLAVAKRQLLHATFTYTGFYHRAALRRLLGLPTPWRLSRPTGLRAGITAFLGRYVANATLVVRRAETYGRAP